MTQTAGAGSLRGWGAGARVAGSILALGYLLGLVGGPLTAVAGALALITLGRCVAAGRSDDLVLAGALATLAGALQVAALRWETLDLAELRGAQAVLGPTVLVGPEAVAAASIAGAVAATAGLAVWLATVRRTDEASSGPLVRALWIAEALIGGLAIVTAFWGGSVPRGSFGGGSGLAAVGEWLAAVAVVAGVAAGAALYVGRVFDWRHWILGGAALSVAAATVVVTTAVT